MTSKALIKTDVHVSFLAVLQNPLLL